MELRQLRYFVAVAEELHFGRAAERLDVVQPAVSQQLARLERELGVALLRRNSRRVSLTAEGVHLLELTRSALAATERIREVAGDLATGRTGVLRLGTTSGLGERLPRGMAALGALVPHLELILVDGTGPAHSAAVASGQLNAALVRGEFATPGVRATPLGDQPHSAVLPSDHPAAADPAVRLDQIADLILRMPPRATDPSLREVLAKRAANSGVPLRQGRDVTSVEDTVSEIAVGRRSWTVLADTQLGLILSQPSAAVVVRPLDPPLHLPVLLLMPDGDDKPCARLLADAFR